MDIGCNIPDHSLLRNLAEDVPDMAPSIRHRLRELADLIEAREAQPAPLLPALLEGMREVPCAIRDDGWLFIPHANGNWVTAAKLQPFSMAIIECWRAEQRTAGVTAGPATDSEAPSTLLKGWTHDCLYSTGTTLLSMAQKKCSLCGAQHSTGVDLPVGGQSDGTR